MMTLYALVVFFISLGCYEMKQDEKGRTVKMNRLTGEISVIEGDKIIKLKDENDIKAQHEATMKLGAATNWGKIELGVVSGLDAKLITKWSNGVLYYQFFVNKNLRQIKNAYAQFTIQLQDDALFVIEQIPISVSMMTAQVSEDGKTITGMEYKGQVFMLEDAYRKIGSWNVSYSGFK
jgi:hypothetical protein